MTQIKKKKIKNRVNLCVAVSERSLLLLFDTDTYTYGTGGTSTYGTG